MINFFPENSTSGSTTSTSVLPPTTSDALSAPPPAKTSSTDTPTESQSVSTSGTFSSSAPPPSSEVSHGSLIHSFLFCKSVFIDTTTPDAGGGGCECRSGGPAGDGGDRGGHHRHFCGDEEAKQAGLCTAAVDRGSYVHECSVQWYVLDFVLELSPKL